MPDFIQDNIQMYGRLKEVYQETVFGTLKEPCNKLKELFTQLLNDKASEFSLLASNSVYRSKYYQVKERIKKGDSFYEKLIRKNLGLEIVGKFELLSSVSTLEDKKSQVVNEIQKIDDLIGLRIVTELKEDCKNVYKLLLNSAEFFQANSIKFYDLDDQPQQMQNGLGIYRIKGVFQSLFSFELQIKSKIDEAWGDMDHSLFYKDYSISPIKDTVQVTMNNVGILLDKIERLLYDLRESGANYSENAEHLKFQENLEAEVSETFLQEFKVPIKLKEISIYLKFFKDKAGIGDEKLGKINFEHLNWSINDEFCLNFIRIRNKDHRLIVIETLYLNWKRLFNPKFELNAENYPEVLREFLSYYNIFISSQIGVETQLINDSFTAILPYVTSPDLFMSIKRIKENEDICRRLENIGLEEEQVRECEPELKNGFRIILFNGSIEGYLRSIDRDKDIANAFFKLRAAIESSNNPLDQLIYKSATIALEIIKKMQND